MTLKFWKKNINGKVKISASATILENGRVKTVGSKPLSFKAGEWGKELAIDFWKPIGRMTLESSGDDVFTLQNSRYKVTGLAIYAKTDIKRDIGVGGDLPDGTMSFKVDFKNLPALDGTLVDALPTDVVVRVSGGKKFDFGKAAYPKFTKTDGGFELVGLDDPMRPNLSGLKLRYSPKTGLFRGSFKIYVATGGTRPRLKKYTVNVVGIVVDGLGTGQATLIRWVYSRRIIRSIRYSWPVTIE